MYERSRASVESTSSSKRVYGIVRIFFNNTITLELNTKHTFLIGEILKLKIFNELTGYYIYTGKVKSFTNSSITLTNVVLNDLIQRRKSKRIFISDYTNIKSIVINKSKLLQFNKELFMKAKDISYSGILLESPLDISNDINFLINLNIENSCILLETTTVRKYTKNNLFYYGCTYTLKNIEDKKLLLKYINNNILSELENNNPKITCYYNNL